MRSLREVLEEFDGRDRTRLIQLVERGLTDEEYAQLPALCAIDDARRGRGAAWLVRTLHEKKRGAALDVATAFRALALVDDWSSRYHLLQTMRYAPHTARAFVEPVRALLDDPRTALRAAALDAFLHIALVDEAHIPEARARIMAAFHDDKAGVRARGRNMAKILERHDARRASPSPAKRKRAAKPAK